MVFINNNVIYTKGFINESGFIEIPGIFLEEGAIVDIAITVIPGNFEIAILPSETDEADIFEKDCSKHENCDDCPVEDECRKDLEI